MDSSTSLPHPNALTGSIGLVNDKESFSSFMQNASAQIPATVTSHQSTGLEEVDSSVDDTESLDSNCSIKKDVSPRPNTGIPRTSARNITVQTLMQDGILQPGPGVLTIDYLGQKFHGDLLANGKILWENTQFASPSSWATFIKKRLNPSKKSGSGWNSVKYKGKKLDKLKQSWLGLQKNSHPISASGTSPVASVNDDGSLSHDNKTIDEKKLVSVLDPNALIECETFSDLKPQPFSVVVSSLVMAVVDFHCHLTSSEVVGYLGGKWEPTTKCLYVIQAFPCRCKLHDQDVAEKMEREISKNMAANGLARVGWYHSHPSSVALPTLRDVDVQYELQQMNSAYPAVGLICDPYFSCDASRTESVCNMFWVMPNRSLPLEYPVPMKLTYSEVSDQNLPPDASHEFVGLLGYYKLQSESVTPTSIWKGSMTFLDKIQLSMQRRLAKEKSGVAQFVRDLLSNGLPPQTVAS